MPRRPNNPSDPVSSEPRVLVLGADSSLAATCCAALARAGYRLLLLGSDEQALTELDNRLVQNELHAYRAVSLVAGAPSPDELRAALDEWNSNAEALAAVMMFLPAVTDDLERVDVGATRHTANLVLNEPLEALTALIRSLPDAGAAPRVVVVGHRPALPRAALPYERHCYDAWRSACTSLAAAGCCALLVWASGVFTEASLIELQRRAASSGHSLAARLQLELACTGELDVEQPEPTQPADKGSNPNHRDATSPFGLIPDSYLTALDVASTLLSLLEPHAAHLSGNSLWMQSRAE